MSRIRGGEVSHSSFEDTDTVVSKPVSIDERPDPGAIGLLLLTSVEWLTKIVAEGVMATFMGVGEQLLL